MDLSNTTPKDRLIQVLILALTAPTDADAQKAGALAEEFARDCSKVEVEACKDIAIKVFEIMDSSEFAIAPSDAAIDRSLDMSDVGTIPFNDTEKLFVFPDADARDEFVDIVSGATIPGSHELSVFLANRIGAS